MTFNSDELKEINDLIHSNEGLDESQMARMVELYIKGRKGITIQCTPNLPKEWTLLYKAVMHARNWFLKHGY